MPCVEPLQPPPYEQITNQERGVQSEGREEGRNSPPPPYQTIDRRQNHSAGSQCDGSGDTRGGQ